MGKRQFIVKVDVDGVLRDFLGACLELYNREMPNMPMKREDCTAYDITVLFSKLNLKHPEMNILDWFLNYHSYDIFQKAKCMFGAREALQRLIDDGHKVIISTHQKLTANKVHTLYFLDRFEIPYHDIFFSKEKSLVCGDFLIDDNPAMLRESGMVSTPLLVDAPYNQHETGFPRFASITEAVDYIIRLANEDEPANHEYTEKEEVSQPEQPIETAPEDLSPEVED